MGEVLSQNEIDSLLAALSTGELDVDEMQDKGEKQVKNYDFKRPAKFSKEHLRTLEIIYEHYGRLLATTLPVYLRKNVQVTVASSETVTFSEFTNALSNPVILGIINFQPLGGNIILDLAANLGFAIIDRMLGGKGVPLEKNREFSEIEMAIIEKIMIISLQLMREPWKNVLDISPILERIETNPQFAQVIAPSEMIAIVTLNMKIGDVEGFMNICLPYFTLESVMDKLNTKYWFSTMQDSSSEDYEITIYIEDNNHNPIEMAEPYFDDYLNSWYDENGYYHFFPMYLDVGTHKVEFTLDDGRYKAEPVSINLKIVPSIFYGDIKCKSYYGTDKTTLTMKATVYDPDADCYEDGYVTFKVNGKSYKVKTKNGVATKTIKIKKAGTYTYTAKFTNNNYKSSVTGKAKLYVYSTTKKARTFNVKGYKFTLYQMMSKIK